MLRNAHTTQIGVPRVMPSGDRPDKISQVSVSLRGVVMRLWPVRYNTAWLIMNAVLFLPYQVVGGQVPSAPPPW